MSRLLNNEPRRISNYRLQRRPSFGFESSVSSTPMWSGDPVYIPPKWAAGYAAVHRAVVVAVWSEWDTAAAARGRVASSARTRATVTGGVEYEANNGRVQPAPDLPATQRCRTTATNQSRTAGRVGQTFDPSKTARVFPAGSRERDRALAGSLWPLFLLNF